MPDQLPESGRRSVGACLMAGIPNNPGRASTGRSIAERAALKKAQAARRSSAGQSDSQSDEANAEETQDAPPVGQGDYVVKQGDCISSIAKDHGYFWETIWNDPANSELKETRVDPNVLLPGDRVTLPEKATKQDVGATEERHRFVRRGEPAFMRVRILKGGQPRSNEPYTLEVGATQTSGVLDVEGTADIPIQGNASVGVLTVGEADDQTKHRFFLGEVNPITEVSGIQGRLANLSFDCGPIDGVLGPKTRSAIKAFQRLNKLKVNGQPDTETRNALEKQFGS
jgi:Putative peptidoglycan binding domain